MKQYWKEESDFSFFLYFGVIFVDWIGTIFLQKVKIVLRVFILRKKHKMLDLLAVSYWNIGPFRDQKKTLFFHKGKYLIKAPIGSGKSFLFFDGPSYALYKSASRNLLNIQSKIGMIKLLFSYNDQVFLIKRTLKKGKSKDSCASQLFQLSESPEVLEEKFLWKPVLQDDLDLEEYLQKIWIQMEEESFKNESDLQAHLDDFLPPQAVFTSTAILLQDAKNIFELQPAERLEVLKNVFNLMSIDETKEVVKEKRNEVKYQIKAYEDTSLVQEKLKNWLKTLISTRKMIDEKEQLSAQIAPVKDVFEELEMLVEKMGIDQFELDEVVGGVIAPMQSVIAQHQEHYQQQKSQISASLTQKNDLERQVLNAKTDIEKSERRIAEIDRLLEKVSLEGITQLRNEKLQLQNQQKELEKEGFAEQIQHFWQENGSKLDLEARSDFGLLQNWLAVQSLIALGKNLKSWSELLTEQVENLKAKAQTEQTRLQDQIKSLMEREQFYTQQLENLAKKIADFDAATEESAHYECQEIGAACPFIKAINKQHFEQREQEKQKILKEDSDLKARIQAENLAQKLQIVQQELEKIKSWVGLTEQMQTISSKQRENEEKIQILRAFLLKIDFKKLEELAGKYKGISEKIIALERELVTQEQLANQAQTYQQEKSQLQGMMRTQSIQIEQLMTQKSQIEEQMAVLQEQISQYQQDNWDLQMQLVQRYEATYQSLQTLIFDYKNLQIKIKWLAEQGKILDNLYAILNKELLLFVLSEYLPILSDVVNSYLVGVVDYQISIRLMETSEKLELETKILDAKGERDIKSLSGGQRAVLKLVWMLAISSYMKTKLLFLDETINNLDNETVGRVSEMLTAFVKQRDMKFYTITHNAEIQEMKIWDDTIEVKP